MKNHLKKVANKIETIIKTQLLIIMWLQKKIKLLIIIQIK